MSKLLLPHGPEDFPSIVISDLVIHELIVTSYL